MKHPKYRQTTALLTVLFVLSLFVSAAVAAAPPKVTLTVTGDPVPGATVTAKATVVINDGSTLQSIKWTQTGGAPATLVNNTTDTITLTLPDRKAFREELVNALIESPVDPATLPAYVKVTGEFANGLQDRWGVAGVSNHALEEGGAITFDVTVTTTSGTYHVKTPLAAKTPWITSTANRNVAIGTPVVLHGKKQATYNWTLTRPTGSTVTLIDPTTQNPEFTPDVAGEYKFTVTDLKTNAPVTVSVFGGRWRGIVTGQDANGRPTTEASCKNCHVGKLELFTPWANSGHAEIFTQNLNTPNGHYGPSCLGCHTVGYDAAATTAPNGGIDEAADFQAFVASGLMSHGDPLNWTKVLTQFPATAKMSNIQCENCHGPQDSTAHGNRTARETLSSDVCGSCHGEPTRHGRFQQWQLSGHANFATAVSEGTDATCAKCHSAQGFLQWQDTGFSTATLNVTWTTDEVQPQTCAVCHDPHAEGTTSSDAKTNATVRVMGNTPVLMAGFTAKNVGKGATCMTCHNGRRGLKNDANFVLSDAARAPHEGPQADIVMGENLFFTKTGNPGFHSMIQDSCVTCHMNATNPPAAVALQNADGSFVGTNHTFFADRNICSKCHTEITADAIQGAVEAKMTNLKAQLETSIITAMKAQIRAGNVIDVNGTKVKNGSDITSVAFESSHGSQAVTVTLAGGTKVADVALTAVKVVRPTGSSVALYSVTDPAVAKAGWNYLMVEADKSKGVHNPAFVNSALDLSLYATNAFIQSNGTSAAAGNNNPAASFGGGLGNGAGAVACTTPYVYWTEIAGHIPGAAGSQWRTDVIARNLGSGNASLKFVLHQLGAPNLEGTGTVTGGGQKAFEDLVGQIGGGNNLGALEICSDQPLLVNGRIFNQADNGTFGQNLDGKVADFGHSAGETVHLIGLRQSANGFRTNLSVTNAGTTEGQVSITLFDATGASLKTYTLTVPAGTVVQDTEPFLSRANAPDLNWGFATVTVLKGTNIHTSASLIDNKTNDPTTIEPKQ